MLTNELPAESRVDKTPPLGSVKPPATLIKLLITVSSVLTTMVSVFTKLLSVITTVPVNEPTIVTRLFTILIMLLITPTNALIIDVTAVCNIFEVSDVIVFKIPVMFPIKPVILVIV